MRFSSVRLKAQESNSCSLGNAGVALRREYLPLEPRQVEILAALGAVAPLEGAVRLHHLLLGETGQKLEGVDVLSVDTPEESVLFVQKYKTLLAFPTPKRSDAIHVPCATV